MVRVQIGFCCTSPRGSFMKPMRPVGSAAGSLMRTVMGRRFSWNEWKLMNSCSVDLVSGTRLPAISMYCGLPSNTCGIHTILVMQLLVEHAIQRLPNANTTTQSITNLDLFAARNFSEVLLTLERLVKLVVGHTEHTETSLFGFRALTAKTHELGHEGNDHALSVHASCVLDSLPSAGWSIDQPESS